LPENKNFSGIIIREKNGHRFITPFSDDEKKVNEIEKNLKKSGAQIIERIKKKDKHYVRERVLKLNKDWNLPGVNGSLEAQMP